MPAKCGATEPTNVQAVDDVRWGELEFRVTSHRTDRHPEAVPITSARAIVRRARRVLVVCDPTSVHVLPGGRLEPGEEPEHALHREVLEETGWHLGIPTLLGYLHFHHRSPRPTTGWQPPYPEFCQLVMSPTRPGTIQELRSRTATSSGRSSSRSWRSNACLCPRGSGT